MTDHNQVVGRVIASHAPAGWQKAWVTAKAQDGYVGELVADYVDRDGNEQWFDLADAGDIVTLSDALLAMRDDIRPVGKEGFSSCTFTLFPDGRFKFDVGYD